MWCCCETEQDLEMTPMAPLVDADQVLPSNFVKEVKFAEEATESRMITASSSLALSSPGSPGSNPPRKASTFTVELHRRPSASFGVDLSAAGKICLVNSVQDGSLVADWNERLIQEGDLERTIKPFDRLMSFNDQKPHKGKEVLEMLRASSGPVTLVVQRPKIRKILVRKTTRSLGISVVHGPAFLLITDISEGVFNQHNAFSKEVVSIPSRIIGVDGQRGNGEKLLKCIEDVALEAYFEIEVLRYEG